MTTNLSEKENSPATPDNNSVKEKDVSKKKTAKKQATKLLDAENISSVPFSVVEAYKNIRLQLTTILAKTNGKIIAISSPNASEGKSTTTVNIAIILSQLNKKVLVIDADIRRGTVHKKLKLENELGIVEVLSGTTEAEKAIKKYNPTLDVITCGQYTSATTEIFESSAFEALLKKVNDIYDYIIIDTPPVNLVTDSLVISKKCDGLLYVIRSSVTTYEAFRKSLNLTESLNINLLGVILNAVDVNSGKYYKYSKYSRYYNNYYYSDGYGNYSYHHRNSK